MVAEAESGMDRELDATSDELRQAVREALGLVENDDPNRRSVKRWAEFLGISEWLARKKIRDAMEAGTMERKPIRQRCSDGRIITVPGYKLVTKDD